MLYNNKQSYCYCGNAIRLYRSYVSLLYDWKVFVLAAFLDALL